MIDIKHEFNDRKGTFYIEDGNKRLAEMTYVMAGDTKMIIDHTEVDDSLRGQGIVKNFKLNW